MTYYEVNYIVTGYGGMSASDYYRVEKSAEFDYLVDALNFIDERGIKEYKLYKIKKQEITVNDSN